MRIGIIGAGNVGQALGKGLAKAGHEIVYGAREPGAAPHEGSRVDTVRNAVAASEAIVLATPWAAVPDALAAAGDFGGKVKTMGDLTGKVLVDCSNAIGKGFTLVHGHTTSSAEEIAKALPGTKVVRAFNQQGAEVLRNPRFGGKAATSFVAADDDGVRALVIELSDDVGLDSVSAGPLSSSRLLEPMTLVWIAMSQTLGTREFGLSLRRR
jgi:hypothetical protein